MTRSLKKITIYNDIVLKSEKEEENLSNRVKQSRDAFSFDG